MKKIITHTALTSLVLLMAACGETSTEPVLPEGAAPNPPADTTPVDPPADASGTSDPQPEVKPEPVVAPTPPVDPASTDEPAVDPAKETAERLSIPGMTYVLPEGWKIGPAKQMRNLTLLPPDRIVGADLAISKWPGDVGGFASNVTRWVRQAGLPPVTGLTTAANSDFEQFQIDGTTATWIPLMNESANVAILAVWVPRGENPDKPTETWTFKLTCKADQVESLAPAVRAWCESIKFAD